MIPLFFSDFKRFVKSEQFKGAMVHPVLYFETEEVITFYKPVESVIYFTTIDKLTMPKDIDLKNLKIEFNATELPMRLNTSSQLNLVGTLN